MNIKAKRADQFSKIEWGVTAILVALFICIDTFSLIDRAMRDVLYYGVGFTLTLYYTFFRKTSLNINTRLVTGYIGGAFFLCLIRALSKLTAHALL